MPNEPLKDKRLVEITEHRTKIDWTKFMNRIADKMSPKAKKIKLIIDNFIHMMHQHSLKRFARSSKKTQGQI